jgi:hypothetical protein
MSMEMCVLSEVQLKSIAEWQQAIELEGFPLRLSFEEPFSSLNGFLPAVLRNKRTGFECYHVRPKELIETYSEVQFDRKWTQVLAFVWGGDFAEMQAAWMAAASYAKATGGVVFDEQAGQILTAADALESARASARRYAET